MEIEFVCERCGKPLKVDDTLAGQPMECYHCHAETAVPQPGAKATIEFSCSGCGAKFRVPASRAGSRTKCPKCGALLVVPDASTRPTPAPAPAEPSVYGLATPPPMQAPQTPAPEPLMGRSRMSKYAGAPAMGADGQPVKRANKTQTGMIIFWAALGILVVVALIFNLSKRNNQPAGGAGGGPVQIQADAPFNAAINGLILKNTSGDIWNDVTITIKFDRTECKTTLPSLGPDEHRQFDVSTFPGFSGVKYPMKLILGVTLPNGTKGEFTQNYAEPKPPVTPPASSTPAPKKAAEKPDDGGKITE